MEAGADVHRPLAIRPANLLFGKIVIEDVGRVDVLVHVDEVHLVRPGLLETDGHHEVVLERNRRHLVAVVVRVFRYDIDAARGMAEGPERGAAGLQLASYPLVAPLLHGGVGVDVREHLERGRRHRGWGVGTPQRRPRLIVS